MELAAQQGGYIARKTGNELEVFIHDRLKREGYVFVPPNKFEASKLLEQPTYTRQFKVGKGVYDTSVRCDFILYHPQRHPDCLVIESKWQQTSGSIDEKYPYLILNINANHFDTIIIVDGGGYRLGALQWLKKQVGGRLKYVFSMSEFMIWVNKNKL